MCREGLEVLEVSRCDMSVKSDDCQTSNPSVVRLGVVARCQNAPSWEGLEFLEVYSRLTSVSRPKSRLSVVDFGVPA